MFVLFFKNLIIWSLLNIKAEFKSFNLITMETTSILTLSCFVRRKVFATKLHVQVRLNIMAWQNVKIDKSLKLFELPCLECKHLVSIGVKLFELLHILSIILYLAFLISKHHFKKFQELVTVPSLPNLEPNVFGYTTYIHLKVPGKLDPHVVRCIFVGYADFKKGYRCYDPHAKKMYVTRDVSFHEEVPFFDGPKCSL